MAESSGRSCVIYNDTALPCTVLNINEALCIPEFYYPLCSTEKWGWWVFLRRVKELNWSGLDPKGRQNP